MPDAEDPPASTSLEIAARKGSQLAGALIGAGLGILNPFAGAAAGFAATEALQRLGAEVISRVGDRAAVRAGAAVAVIAQDADTRERDGQTLRDDGFFDPDGDLRPPSDELMEGVLRRAAETYEERKVPYISYIYTSVAYDDEYAWPDAMFYLALADRLIYRQFATLASYLESEASFHDRLNATLEREAPLPDQLNAELQALVDEGLLGPEVIDGGDATGQRTPRSVSSYELTSLGRRFARALRLDLIPEEEILDWLRGPAAVEREQRPQRPSQRRDPRESPSS
jgi:hypothetical protein